MYNTEKIFWTSDTHFSHSKVIEYSKRPFENVEIMDSELISRWNKKVPKDGTVFHIGDFALTKSGRIHQILNQLNGKICLIKGNHDSFNQEIANRFEWVKDYFETKIDNNFIVMFHYPLMTWNKSKYGSWMFHGHCHGSLKDVNNTRVDVGIDTHPNYEPYSWKEIVEKMENRKYIVVDHHKPRAQ